jgi:hypothetical protein
MIYVPFNRFKPTINDATRYCLGCKKPIPAGEVCRSFMGLTIHVIHNLDCHERFVEKLRLEREENNYEG